MTKQNIINLLMRIMPIFSILCVLFTSYMPLMPPNYHGFAPNLMPVMVLFWAIYLPQFCPMLFIFACGLFIDIITNGILGAHSFLFIVIYFIAVRFHEALQSLSVYLQILIAFIPISVIFMIELVYMLSVLSHHHGLFLATKYMVTICVTIPLWLSLQYILLKCKGE